MRINTPTTNVEQEIKEGAFIVSKTDLKGKITYINQSFIDISGFTEKELLGQPHNLVRHPDMPAAAFEDLWNTLRKGKPWSGLVKNRCKNGDYYWVQANATPISEGGDVVGYMSVRTKPSRAQIEAAEKLYRNMREGRSTLKIHEGALLQPGLLHAAGRAVRDMSIAWRLALLALLFSLLTLGIGGNTLYGLAKAHRNLEQTLKASPAWLAVPDSARPARQEVERRIRISQEDFRGETVGTLSLIALALSLGAALSIAAIRSIANPLRTADEQLRLLAQGDFAHRIEIGQRNELGRLLEGMKSMQIRTGFEVAESKRIAGETMRIKVALDNASTNVMIADRDGHIIYLNKSVLTMLKDAEADIRKELPDFAADKLLGAHFDSFHKNPAHQRNLLNKLTATYNATVRVGGRTFYLTANPVIDESGERLGSSVEWIDATADEEAVNHIIRAAQQGNLGERLKLDGKQGIMRKLSEGINLLLGTVSEAVSDVERVLSALAKGDLTQTISRDYQGTFGQLKDNANLTVENLKGLLIGIKESVDAINMAAQEITSGNADLSQRTQEQASSLEETATSMKELTGTVKQNAGNARQANQLASASSGVAAQGGSAVRESVHTIVAISESSKKMADIIGVIDGIAFQTNILALNAAVEAARAGEQGRGFAVVAGEVRNLAQRSASAAKEIKKLIADSVEKVKSGSAQVNQAGATMEEIVVSIKQVSDIMTEITAASAEQASGIEQVYAAITQMDEMTQQNAALVEESAAASESLEEQARNLARSVSAFKLGSGAATPPRHNAAEASGTLEEAKTEDFLNRIQRISNQLSPEAAAVV
ncbi:MAG: PAS domain-containing protein [Sulfuricellaceae bacterium]|nr:PAS domain-containing protein [Sulfuricellaceae bacterium]